MKVTIKGTECEVLQSFDVGADEKGFRRERAIVDMDGTLVMADLSGDENGEKWDFGGPARQGPELDALNALMKSRLGTTVTTTKPDGSSTTVRDK